MISFMKVDQRRIIKAQYFYKLKSFSNLLSPLMFMQLFGLLFSLGGIANGTKGQGRLELSYYSADFIYIMTAIWLLIIAIQMTGHDYRGQLLPFVRDDWTNHLSDMLFLLSASIIGIVFTRLSRYLLMNILFILGYDQMFTTYAPVTVLEWLKGIVAMVLFLWLISGFGYLIGTLVQWNRLFIVLIPAFFLGMLFILMIDPPLEKNVLYHLFVFYFQEHVFVFFAIKVLLTSFLFFLSAYGLSRRLEVS